MPAASTTLCVQCQTEASKYTCPACKARTCSLACTRAHKSGDRSSSAAACSSSRYGSTTCVAASGSTSTPHATTTCSGGTDFIPMTQYTESHMLQDYLFLSSISRTTSETGRQIVSMNLLPAPTTDGAKHQVCASATGAPRLTNQQRQRDQLIKQLHYRKFKVMVLPEGMARRKSNMSQFQPKDKKFGLTVQLKLPHHSSRSKPDEPEPERDSWLLHKQDCLETVEAVVLTELQTRSFANKKDISRLRATLHLSSKDVRSWILSAAMISTCGLAMPSIATNVDKTLAKHGEDHLLVLHAFPQEWTLLVPAYSARLANESTSRYLDWWARKRKWEESNPELAAQQSDEQRKEASAGREGRRGISRIQRERGEQTEHAGSRNCTRIHADARPEQVAQRGMQKPSADNTTTTTTASTMVSSAYPSPAPTVASQGLISSNLLSMLSQRLGRQPQPQPSTTLSASPPPPSTTASTQRAPPTAATQPRSSPAQPAQPAQPESARSILVHITSPRHTTLSWLLQTLPEGYSVVEYPELRIVAAERLERMQNGGVQVVPLMGEGLQANGAPKDDEPRPEHTGSTVTHMTNACARGLGGLLAGYDSESDCEQQPEQDQIRPDPIHTVELAQHADRVDHQVAQPSTLASLARQHGFT